MTDRADRIAAQLKVDGLTSRDGTWVAAPTTSVAASASYAMRSSEATEGPTDEQVEALARYLAETFGCQASEGYEVVISGGWYVKTLAYHVVEALKEANILSFPSAVQKAVPGQRCQGCSEPKEARDLAAVDGKKYCSACRDELTRECPDEWPHEPHTLIDGRRCMGRTPSTAEKPADVYGDIRAERERQEQRVQRGEWKHSCADAEMNPYQKLTVLAEEFGEVARATLEHDDANLRDELVQVAAVAVAWHESLSTAEKTSDVQVRYPDSTEPGESGGRKARAVAVRPPQPAPSEAEAAVEGGELPVDPRRERMVRIVESIVPLRNGEFDRHLARDILVGLEEEGFLSADGPTADEISRAFHRGVRFGWQQAQSYIRSTLLPAVEDVIDNANPADDVWVGTDDVGDAG